jgi:hypothetical protein
VGSDDIPEDLVVVRLDGDPEVAARALLDEPPFRLDTIDLHTEEGLEKFLLAVMTRIDHASLERDELVGFAERNHDLMPSVLDETLPLIQRAAGASDETTSVAKFVEYLSVNLRHAADGRPEQINVKSDVLMYLTYVLACQLDNGTITYDGALRYLTNPPHRDRISPLSLAFMVKDYGDAQDRPPIEYLMLIAEEARAVDDVDFAWATFGLVIRLLPAMGSKRTGDFLASLIPYFDARRPADPELDDAIRALQVKDLSPDEF